MHRDVKPGNVLLADDGRAKVTDFGIARAVDDVTITSTGMMAGTPAYLAPEVARGADADFRSDVYSLGSTLYAALEGAPPYGTGDNALAVLHRVASGEYDPPAHRGPITALVEQMLRAEPVHRPDMPRVAADLAWLVSAGAGTEEGPVTPFLTRPELGAGPSVTPGAPPSVPPSTPRSAPVAGQAPGSPPAATPGPRPASTAPAAAASSPPGPPDVRDDGPAGGVATGTPPPTAGPGARSGHPAGHDGPRGHPRPGRRTRAGGRGPAPTVALDRRGGGDRRRGRGRGRRRAARDPGRPTGGHRSRGAPRPPPPTGGARRPRRPAAADGDFDGDVDGGDLLAWQRRWDSAARTRPPPPPNLQP